MAIYLIFENEIHDPDAYERYKAAARPMVEAAGGEYLARDGRIDVIAGDWHPGRIVVFKWPDRKTMQDFLASEPYRPWKELRESVTTTKSMILVEGEGHQEPE